MMMMMMMMMMMKVTVESEQNDRPSLALWFYPWLLTRLTLPRFRLYVDSSWVSCFDVDSMVKNPGMLR